MLWLMLIGGFSQDFVEASAYKINTIYKLLLLLLALLLIIIINIVIIINYYYYVCDTCYYRIVESTTL